MGQIWRMRHKLAIPDLKHYFQQEIPMLIKTLWNTQRRAATRKFLMIFFTLVRPSKVQQIPRKDFYENLLEENLSEIKQLVQRFGPFMRERYEQIF